MPQQTMKDSGTLDFSPPDCYHIVLSGGKIDQSSCGDTSWIKSSDGSIIRKIGTDLTSKFAAPRMEDMLKVSNTRIIKQSANEVTIEMLVPLDKMTAKAQFTFDTDQFVMRRSTIIPPTGIAVESGYAYDTFEGKLVLKEISTVFGTAGFAKISFHNYKRIPKIPRSKFKKM